MTFTLDEIVAELASQARDSGEGRRANKADRKAELRQALDGTADPDKLFALSQRIEEGVALMFQPTLERPTSQDQLDGLMAEEIAHREIRELLEARREMRREVIFSYMEELGVSKLTSSTGKGFFRCGGNAVFRIDHNLLALALGEQAKRVLKPKPVEYLLDKEALMGWAAEDPSVMDIVRECVVEHERRTPVSLRIQDQEL